LEAAEPVEWTEGMTLLMLLAAVCLRAQHLHLPGASAQTSVPPSLCCGMWGMVSNLGHWAPGTRHTQLLPLWSACLAHALPAGWLPPAAELASITSALTCNVFSMWLKSYTSYGSVVEPWAALMNHSCTPNLARVQSHDGDSVMRFVAIRDIAANEELTHSYLHSYATYQERRRATRSEYCFECECARCKVGMLAAAEHKSAEKAAKAAAKGSGRRPVKPRKVAEQRLPTSTACACGGWMYPLGDASGAGGVRVCSVCGESEDESILVAGMRVRAHAGGELTAWYRGEVLRTNANGTYAIAYDDGDREMKVRRHLIRADGDVEAVEGGGAAAVEGGGENEGEEDGGHDLASSECHCGGWRFQNGDVWMCVHCDHTIRVSPRRDDRSLPRE